MADDDAYAPIEVEEDGDTNLEDLAAEINDALMAVADCVSQGFTDEAIIEYKKATDRMEVIRLYLSTLTTSNDTEIES